MADFTSLLMEPEVLNNDFISETISAIYKSSGQDWYKTYPYVFSIENTDPESDEQFIYALPIPPESLITQMVAASDAVPTLGGVIEEPSATVFWNIQLSGTTGMAIGRNTNDETKEKAAETSGGLNASSPASVFREAISKTGLASSLTQAALNAAQYVAQAAAVSSVVEGAQFAIQPKLPYFQSAVSGFNNGYTEIHRLHKFFIFYSHLNSRKDSNRITMGSAAASENLKSFNNDTYNLFFTNYKDNQKFRIVLKNFSISKSANSPFLYRYQIQIKAWNLQEASGDTSKLAVDRFKGGDLSTVNTLTATSLVTKAKNVLRLFNSAKTDPLGTFLPIPPVI